MKYLGDYSVIKRIVRQQVDPMWDEVSADGEIAICEPVLHEIMRIAGKREYEGLQSRLLDTYDCIPLPAPTWDYVREMRNGLGKRSVHDMLSVTDAIVAAVAIHHKLVVLHNDKDFAVCAKIFPQLEQLRVPELLPPD